LAELRLGADLQIVLHVGQLYVHVVGTRVISAGGDTQLAVAAQAERVQAPVGGQVDERVAATARDLRHLAAHQVGDLTRQVLVADLTVA